MSTATATDRERTLYIARTIIEQLGGNKFKVMTGANNILALGDGVSFKLPKFDGLKINYVKIILEPSDTYTVEFGRVYGSKYTVLSTHSDIYCDVLVDLFERKTGLRTSLSR